MIKISNGYFGKKKNLYLFILFMSKENEIIMN